MSLTLLLPAALVALLAAGFLLARRASARTIGALRSELERCGQAGSEIERRAAGFQGAARIVMACASAPPGTDVFQLLAERIHQLTGALALVITEYDPARSELVVRQVRIPEPLASVDSRIGAWFHTGSRIELTPAARAEIVDHPVVEYPDLTALTFGRFPPEVTEEVRAKVGSGSFLGIALKDGSDLLGTIVLAMPARPRTLPLEVAEMFGTVASLLLRRQRAEESRSATEARFSQMVDLVPQAVFETDLEGRIVFTNRAGLQMLGYPAEALQEGLTIDEVVVPEERPRAREAFGRALAGQDATADEYDLSRRDGSRFPAVVSASAIVQDGRPAGLRGVVVDVSQLERARRDRDLLATVVEQAAESIVITDRDAAIQYVNPAFEKCTGYKREEVVGRNPRLLKSGRHDEDFYRGLWRTITAGWAWYGRLVNRRSDGTLLTEEAIISPVFDRDGAIRNFVSVRRDVTGEIELERRYAQAQKLEAVGRLAGGIAHDFNNILTAVAGYTDLLQRQLPPDGPGHQALEEIRDAVFRANTLTSQLLTIGRKQVVQPRSVHLNTVVKELEPTLRARFRRQVELAVELDPAAGKVVADRAQIEQVIQILAMNALDAMPAGGRLTLTTCRLPGETGGSLDAAKGHPRPLLLLEVADTGVGMSEQVKAHLFEPFFTTKQEDKGVGLGLSTVHGVVEQCGGYIEVASEPGCGTTFRIYLPEEVPPSAAAGGARPGGAGTGGGETILLAEDDPAILTDDRAAPPRAGLHGPGSRGREGGPLGRRRARGAAPPAAHRRGHAGAQRPAAGGAAGAAAARPAGALHLRVHRRRARGGRQPGPGGGAAQEAIHHPGPAAARPPDPGPVRLAGAPPRLPAAARRVRLDPAGAHRCARHPPFCCRGMHGRDNGRHGVRGPRVRGLLRGVRNEGDLRGQGARAHRGPAGGARSRSTSPGWSSWSNATWNRSVSTSAATCRGRWPARTWCSSPWAPPRAAGTGTPT